MLGAQRKISLYEAGRKRKLKSREVIDRKGDPEYRDSV